MLSDEEKKAIEFIKSELQDEKVRVDYQSLSGLYGNLEIEILLNLIKKLSKEIEELKDINEEIGKALDEWINGERTSIFHIHKDKIKAKIEDILNSENGEAIEKLIEWQSLLEKE